jgi:bifunctional non-homologous end joining protein LigD
VRHAGAVRRYGRGMAAKREELTIAGREVGVSNPDKVFFPQLGVTKLELVRYYLAVADGALRGIARRPLVLKRFPDGVEAEPFYQKRAPEHRPPWVQTVTFTFPSGRSAEEIVVADAAQLAWIVNLGCVDLNPHAVRAEDVDHPDELRIDLDPVPGVAWPQIVEVADVARAVLEDHGLVAWPKTSGSRGVHLLVRIRPAWRFDEVRRAALAVAREVERRAPAIATSKWWKEERHGVFLDYNQNARDRTTASAYSVRPTPDARVSMPLAWDALRTCDPGAFTLRTVPDRFARDGDAHAAIDDAAGSLDGLLALAATQAEAGMQDAPWPPHFEKQAGEAARVAPSRARRAGAKQAGAEGGAGAGDDARGEVDGATSPVRTSRRKPKVPVVTIGQAKAKADALAGLERWKVRNPDVAAKLAPEDVLVDTMRGRSSAYYRVRVNLKSVPPEARPAEVAPDPAYDPAVAWKGMTRPTEPE